MLIKQEDIKTTIELTDINKVTVECHNKNEEYKYAYYIYKDNKIIEKIGYSKNNKTVYWLTEAGRYTVKVFIKHENNEKVSKLTESVLFEGIKPVYCSGVNGDRSFQWLKNIISVLLEIWNNRMRMIRLSMYDFTLLNKDSYLGKLWSVLNPLIQIGTYWFVFGMGIRNNSPVGGHPFLPWMLCGLIPWFFISYSITHGSSSIHSKATALRLRYPVYTIPVGAILVGFYNHIVTLIILVVMLITFGYYPNVYWLNIIYYFAYEFVFLTSLAMVTSVLTMIARDFKKLIASLIRLLFYVTPILWNIDRLPVWVKFILKLNPILYIVNGFRDSLLDNQAFYMHPSKIVFFWCLNIVILVLGCNLQAKFRNRFLDML